MESHLTLRYGAGSITAAMLEAVGGRICAFASAKASTGATDSPIEIEEHEYAQENHFWQGEMQRSHPRGDVLFSCILSFNEPTALATGVARES